MWGWAVVKRSSGGGAVEPGRGAEEPELDRSPLRLRQRPRRHDGVRPGRDGRPRLHQEGLAGGGQGDPASVALQQRYPQIGLELGHRLRQGGLGEMKLPRCARDLALLGDGDEVLEVPSPKFHRLGPSAPRADARKACSSGLPSSLRQTRDIVAGWASSRGIATMLSISWRASVASRRGTAVTARVELMMPAIWRELMAWSAVLLAGGPPRWSSRVWKAAHSRCTVGW